MFDFDDTLADSSGVHERVWPAVLAVLRRHVPGLDPAAFLERYDGLMEHHYERLVIIMLFASAAVAIVSALLS